MWGQVIYSSRIWKQGQQTWGEVGAKLYYTILLREMVDNGYGRQERRRVLSREALEWVRNPSTIHPAEMRKTKSLDSILMIAQPAVAGSVIGCILPSQQEVIVEKAGKLFGEPVWDVGLQPALFQRPTQKQVIVCAINLSARTKLSSSRGT